MSPIESSRGRRGNRVRPRAGLAALESLETRELLSFSTLGYSLPDLTVSGYAAPLATYGGHLGVTVNASNIGASTINEPGALAPNSPSTADSPPTTIDVYMSTRPHSNIGSILIGTIAVPSLTQNSSQQITQVLDMPSTRPPGFPGYGGRVFVNFVIDPNHTINEASYANNMSKSVLVRIEAPYPELQAVGLDVPPTMQPGDTIQPNIRIANLGTTDSSLQGPVQVALVASTKPTFAPGSSIIAMYTLQGLTPLSEVPTSAPIFGQSGIYTPNNIDTLIEPNVTLPTSPRKYYLGVVVDPFQQIKQLHQIAGNLFPYKQFELSHVVGPPIAYLPPAGVISATPINPNPFPYPLVTTPIPSALTAGGAGSTAGTPILGELAYRALHKMN
ncbi:MAG: hypothetical protein KGM43_14100 [Planctomycetota bacterium]|nr:hypothetical protein [Planctomycetota bacterium]